MSARDIADDVVLWVRDQLKRLLREYEQQRLALHAGITPPPLDEATAARLISEVEDNMRQDWGGQQVYIHRAGWQDRNGRDSAIRADRASGLSLGQIAVKYCMSKRQVARICGARE